MRWVLVQCVLYMHQGMATIHQRDPGGRGNPSGDGESPLLGGTDSLQETWEVSRAHPLTLPPARRDTMGLCYGSVFRQWSNRWVATSTLQSMLTTCTITFILEGTPSCLSGSIALNNVPQGANVHLTLSSDFPFCISEFLSDTSTILRLSGNVIPLILESLISPSQHFFSRPFFPEEAKLGAG